jgi:hypothetical protein
MLRITEDHARHCLILEPTGSLSQADLERLRERFEAVAAATGRAPNLLVHAASFPSWADLGALAKHVRFIREHHRRIARVAIVSDARALDVAPVVARRLVAADIRHFPEKELDVALAWVAEGAGGPHVTVIEGLPDDTVGISVAGVISAADYDGTIVPLIEERLQRHGRIKLLYRIGPEFESFTAGAVWSDALVGLRHMTDFSRVAVVSDIGWIRHAVRAFAPLIPAEIHVFADKELEAAKAWIATDPPAM